MKLRILPLSVIISLSKKTIRPHVSASVQPEKMASYDRATLDFKLPESTDLLPFVLSCFDAFQATGYFTHLDLAGVALWRGLSSEANLSLWHCLIG
jgi:hypothetical protein